MVKHYDKKEIFTKALKIYMSGKVFVDYIEESELFPLEIKLKRLKQSDLQNNFSIISSELISLQKVDLELIYKEFSFKNIGLQKLPISVVFQNRNALLSFIKKNKEFELFKNNFKMTLKQYPVLKELLQKKSFLVVEYSDVWSKLLMICDFFIQNPRPNIYIRELGIREIDTKFVERYKKVLDKLLSILLDSDNVDGNMSSLSNYGFEKKYYLKYPLPCVRFRILDNSQTIAGLNDMSLNIDEFKNLNPQCRDVYIVENKVTTLSFPALKNSMVIFGAGYGVEVLKDVQWLHDKNIYYWGDIDSDGFAILSQARGYFTKIKSIFMDERTMNSFLLFSVKKKTEIKKELKNLTEDEYAIFEKVQENSFRLEQERIDFNYIKMLLANRF